MNGNFSASISAIAKDIKLFTLDLAANQSLVGFFVGITIAFLLVGFIISKNPTHIPFILRYSSMESFQKISETDKNGTYQMSFANFIKIYTQIRLLSLIVIIAFFVMITTIIITQN